MDIVTQFATGAALGIAMGAVGAVALLKGRTAEGAALLSGPVLPAVALLAAFAGEGLLLIPWAAVKLIRAPFRRANPGSWWFDRVYSEAKRRSIRQLPDPLTPTDPMVSVLLVLWTVVATVVALVLIDDSVFVAGWFGAEGVATAGTAWLLAAPSSRRRDADQSSLAAASSVPSQRVTAKSHTTRYSSPRAMTNTSGAGRQAPKSREMPAALSIAAKVGRYTMTRLW